MAEAIVLEIDRKEPRESLSRLRTADSADIARPHKLKTNATPKSLSNLYIKLFLLVFNSFPPNDAMWRHGLP